MGFLLHLLRVFAAIVFYAFGAGAAIAVSALGCIGTSGLGCAVIVGGAALAESNTIYDGAATVITGSSQDGYIKNTLLAAGFDDADADQYERWIETGLAVATISVDGVLVIRSTSGALLNTGRQTVDDFVATNTAGERLLWGSWNDYPKVTRTGPNGPQEYAQIGDRLYSQHAVARMQPSGQLYSSGVPVEGQPNLVGRDQTPAYVNQPGIQTFDGTQPIRGRSVSPNHVEDIIGNTTPTISPTTGNRSYSSGDVLVVTSSEGRVITIVTGTD